MKTVIVYILFFIGLVQVSWAQTDQNVLLANEYYEGAEYAKAVELYEKLSKNTAYIYQIHDKYLDCMLKLEQVDKAEKYLKKQIKAYPTHAMFSVDYGMLLMRTRRKEEANKFYLEYINAIKKDDELVTTAGYYFLNVGLYDFAEKIYLEGRKNGNRNYCSELGNVYGLAGKNDKMTEEYLNLLDYDEEQCEYVQSLLQSRISEQEDWEKLEPFIMQKVQKNADKIVFNEMLIWYYLQRQDFYKAFIQAKAVDKRKNLEGSKIFEVGILAMNNKKYTNAITIFEYLVEKYVGNASHYNYKYYLMKAREEFIKNTFPVDLEQIKILVAEYQSNIKENGFTPKTVEGARNMALLLAFYLNDKDSAISILNHITQVRNAKQSIVSQSKLDLGDIYLLKGEWWEATLLYSQVEKTEVEKDLGHLAKLKNAKLSYYRGEFSLAKEHLDILKMATSREISNDAMSLSLLIQDNTGLDTTETAMKKYATIDLLLFQQQYQQALKEYDQMLSHFPNHSLTDEIYWQKASIFIKLGNFQEAIQYLEKILTEYNQDIYGDDANFMLGRIYEENLKDKTKAMEYYQKQLLNYQGSVHSAEARKRFRSLRGDKAGS